MSFLFRWHRGGLAESMETIQEFENIESFKAYLEKQSQHFGKELGKLGTSYCGYDSRINWDTWYLTENGYCLGMVNKDLASELESN